MAAAMAASISTACGLLFVKNPIDRSGPPPARTELAAVIRRWAMRSPSVQVAASLEEVTELLLLRRQVPPAVARRRDLQRHPLYDLEAEALEADQLARVFGQQPHPSNAEIVEDLAADSIVP